MADATVNEKYKLEKPIKYERLVAEIATNFVALPSGQISAEIEKTQKIICDSLGIDNTVLYELSENPRNLKVLHMYKQSGLREIPNDINLLDLLPWSFEQALNKNTVILAPISDAPPEAILEKEMCARININYALIIPLFVGGSDVFGAMSFSGEAKDWVWTSELVSRLQLVSQIFAGALARKKAEEALRESDIRLTLAAESANAGLWSWDEQLQLFWATEKARKMHGLPLEGTIRGGDFFRILHGDDRDRVEAEMDRVIQERTILQTEYRVILPGNEIRWISVHAQGLIQPSNEAASVMGISRDISQQMKNEAELSELRLELEHITRVMTLNELSTSLAHEINQPLGAILNNASAALMLMRDFEGQAEIREILKDIVNDSKRAGDVIRRTRGIAAKGQIRAASLNINALIREVISLLQNTIGLQNISLSVDLMHEEYLVCGDRVRLQQVLMNFLTNAIAAVAVNSEKKITIHSRRQSSEAIIISVADTGEGIDVSIMKHIFDPFYTTKSDGLGMGLAICKSIIEENGGRIWVENNPAGGATFSFSLDIIQDTECCSGSSD